MARNGGCGISRDDWKADGAKCGKSPVSPIPGACGVTGYCPEMVSGAGSQVTDLSSNTLGRVPRLRIRGSGQSVPGRCSTLKMHGGTQSIWIN